jgi:hypothetical protein
VNPTVVQVKTDRADVDADQTVTSSPVSAVAASDETSLGHQPRESAVPCSGCQRPTWNFHARCNRCWPVTCPRCGEPGRSPHVMSTLID